MNQPQNIKTSTNFIEVNGIGVVHMKDGSYRDVFVYGYFIFDRWAFIVHRDTEDDRYLTVSEASTGCLLKPQQVLSYNMRTIMRLKMHCIMPYHSARRNTVALLQDAVTS